jgi:hypothetical protein
MASSANVLDVVGSCMRELRERKFRFIERRAR